MYSLRAMFEGSDGLLLHSRTARREQIRTRILGNLSRQHILMNEYWLMEKGDKHLSNLNHWTYARDVRLMHKRR